MGNEYGFDDDWDDENEDQEESSGGPAELRQAYKKMQRELRKTKNLLAEQSKVTRKRTINDALTARGLPAKLAALIPADIGDTSEDVTAWVEEFSDVFVPASQGREANYAEDGTSAEGQPSQGQSFFSEQEIQAQGVIDRANGVVSAPTSDASREAKLEGAESLEELLRIAQGGS